MDLYTILIGLGATLGIWRIYHTAPLEQRNEYMNDGLLVQFFILLGARLGYVLMRWEYYSELPRRVFHFYDGGLSMHGAVLGCLVGFAVVLLISERQPLQIADALIPMLPPLAICVWVASWAFGVAYGEAVSGQVWWALPSPDESGKIIARLPVQIFAAIGTLLVFAWLEINQPFNGIIGLQACVSMTLFGIILSIFTLHRADPGIYWWHFRPEMWAALLLLFLGICGLMIVSLREFRRD